jgi:hypothetical protein
MKWRSVPDIGHMGYVLIGNSYDIGSAIGLLYCLEKWPKYRV